MPKEQYSNIMELKRILSLLAVFLLIFQPLSVFGVSLGDAPSPDVQEAGIISETKYYVQEEYPACEDGKITEPCKCGEKAYNAGFCCRGIWFDPYYENIFSNNTCPAGNFYFVDQNHPNASDDNPGTEEMPWKSARYGAQQLQPGDILFIKEGIYYYYTGSRGEPGITPIRSGTSEAPIVIKAYPGHEVIIMSGPSLDTPPDQFTNPAIGAYHKNYIIIDGFKVYGSVAFWGSQTDPAEGCIVQNCEIWTGHGDDPGNPNTNHQGIRLEYTANCIIRNNIIRDVNLYGSHNYAGIKVYLGSNLLVEHNEIYNCSCGIYDKDSSVNNIYRFNIIHNCPTGWLGPNQNGGPLSQNTKVYQNIFYECNDAYKLLNIAGQQNFQLFNNIFYNSSESTIKALNGEDHRFWNNIIVNTFNPYKQNYGTQPISYSDYNCFYNYDYFSINWTSVGSLVGWQSRTGFDQHSIENDPLFINPESHNFHLQPSSPCLNAGIDRQDYDNDGNTTEPINMGCYITGNETIGSIDLSQYIVEESLHPCPEGLISSSCLCKNPETDQTQEYSSGCCYNGYWHEKPWEEFVLFEDDFEDEDLSEWTYAVPKAEIVSYPLYQGEKVLHIPYCVDIYGQTPECSHNPDCNRFVQIDMSPFNLKQFFIRGYFYVASSENSAIQKKLYYIFSHSRKDYPWDVIIAAWENPLRLTMSSNAYEYSDLAVPNWNIAPLEYDKWYCLELEVKLNTPGIKDGEVRLWLDDKLVYEKTNISIRADERPLGIVRIGAQINDPSDPQPKQEDRYWDAVVIATERIGSLKIKQNTCASQNGVCCQENQTCQNGIFISSSDCGNLCCTGECVSPQLPGDLNDDGHVNVQDIQLNVNVILEIENRPDIIARADVNRDGSVNVLDVQKIVNAVLNA